MPNMSYCRFQNTLADLRDCNDWLSINEPSELLQDEELSAFKRLVKLCENIADNYKDSV